MPENKIFSLIEMYKEEYGTEPREEAKELFETMQDLILFAYNKGKSIGMKAGGHA